MDALKPMTSRNIEKAKAPEFLCMVCLYAWKVGVVKAKHLAIRKIPPEGAE
jgi:hypothetical protein